MKLNEIASAKTGLVLARKEAKAQGEGKEYWQLNLKSVLDNGEITKEDLTRFYAAEELPSNYLTQVGDVIVKTSEPYTAIYISEEYANLVIPSHFVIVRVDGTKAIPEYIAWYLNKDRIKKAYSMGCAGMLKQIRPTAIAETEIKLPSLERQHQVVEVYNLAQKELKLIDELRAKKEVYYKALINKINRM
ncbi:MAG: restriction endonuclease subunit S [Lachnospiraceae bacterium]|nr:restriction endonuclease subunit S [Lachnospiraceae bacterium]